MLHLHRREHGVRVVGQVPGGVEQPVLADVGGADVVEALLEVPTADVVLHLPLDHATLGVEDRHARPDLVGERVEVELATELAVVAPLGLLDAVEVLLERLLGLPGGAVDALELLVLLVAAPVRRCAAHQLEGGDPLGGRQVRAAAQVGPLGLAVATDVVVDGQLAGPDLDGGALGVRGTGAALEADQLDLVGLVLELVSASASVVTRRSKRWFSLMILRIADSILTRSSGTNGVSTSKS